MKKFLLTIFTALLCFSVASDLLAAPPTVQSRYLAFSNISSSTANLQWTRGNGAGRIVVVHYGGTVDWNDFLTNYLTPLDVSGDFSTLTDANGNLTTAFADNDNKYISSGNNYVVIDILTGTGRTSNFTNLVNGTTYNVRVFEYNITGTNADFLTNSSTNNPRSFTTFNVTPPSGLSISAWSEGGKLSWTTDGTNAAGYLLTIKQGSTPVSGYENLDIGKPTTKAYEIMGLAANTAYTYEIKSYDANNNLSNAATGGWTTLTNPSLSACPPTSYSPGHGTIVGIGGTVTINFTATNNQVGLVENITTTINGVNRTSFTDNGNGTYTVVYTVQSGNTDIADASDLPLNINLEDGNGVAFASACTGTGNASNAPGIDANAPIVTNVTSTNTDGSYGIGCNVNVQIVFNEPVTFTAGTGQVQLQLETGSVDQLATRNTTQSGTTIDLTYTVQEGDVNNDLDYTSTTALSLTGTATIKDAGGNDAVLTLPTPSSTGSLGANKNLVIDGVRPTVTSINRQTPSGSCTNVNTVTYRVTFSENIDNSSIATADFTPFLVSGTGTPTVSTVTAVGTPPTNQYDIDVNVTSLTTAEVRLDFTGSVNDDVDNCANASTATFTTGQTYEIDHAAPTASIGGTSAQCYTTAPTSVSGTASDVGCGGVQTVEVAIWVDLNNNGTLDGSDGYWNGTDWTSTTIGTSETFTATGTTSWSWNLPTLPSNDARYYVQVRATDGAGNTSAWSSQTGWYFVVDNTAPTIASGTITAPTTGTCWNSGSKTITWTNANITDTNPLTINLEYSTDNGSTWNTIATGLSNSGSHSWSVPSGLNSTQGLIRITAIDCAGNQTSQNSAQFTFDDTAPTIASGTITAPTTGTCWNSGSKTIIWTNTNITDANSFTINLEYSTDNGSTWNTIITGTTNSGSYSWSVPSGLNSTQGLIRITAIDCAGNQTSQNSAQFTFDDTAPTGGSVTAPLATTCWNQGNKNITWTSATDANLSNTVTIEYSTDNGTTYTTITATASNTGSYTWNVPSGLNSTQGRIRITFSDCAGNTYSITSPQFTFDDTAPTIASGTITAPTTGTCWNSGSKTIIWTNTNITDANSFTINLEYSTDNGSTWNTIITGTTNSGSYSWTVPSGMNSTQGLIRITAIDCAGNQTSQNSAQFTFDDTNPIVSVTSPLSNSYSNGSQVINRSITETNPTTDEARLRWPSGGTNTGAWQTYTPGTTQISSLPSWSSISDGQTFDVEIRHTDCAGNVSAIASATNITKDVTAPTITQFQMSCPPSTSGTITFSEPVYANSNGTGNLTGGNISVTSSGGSATINTSNVSHTAGATTATVNITWTGTLNGFENVTVGTQSATSVYDAAGNAMAYPHTASDNTNVSVTIVSNPSNQSGCIGTTVSFSGSATGGAGLQYQWQESTDNGSTWNDITNGGIYSGATSTTLTLTGITAGMNGYVYRLKAYNECDNQYTTTATLTVHPATAITTQPSNTTICEGSNANLSVTAVGLSLSYQWQYYNGTTWVNVSNGTPTGATYTGGTSANLQISGLTNGNYDYQVIVYGGCAPTTVTSTTATVTVDAAPTITGNPSNATACNGTGTSFSVTSATGTLVWQVSADGGSTWNDLTNSGPYSGVTTTTLSINPVSNGMNGYQYRLKATNGVCSPAYSSAATLTVTDVPTISLHPSDKTQCQGSWSETFSVTASGGSLTYAWEYWNGTTWVSVSNGTPTGATYSGTTTNTLTVNSSTIAAGSYQYRAVVTNSCGSVNSNSATLTVNPATVITTHPSNATICEGTASQTFTVAATGHGTLTYQWQFSSDNTNWSNVTNGTPTGATYTGATSATLTVNTASIADGSNYYYRAVVTGGCGTANSNSAQLIITPATEITTQPTDQTACAGSISVSFSVTANGTPTITYQWQYSPDGSSWSNVSDGTPTGATYSGNTSATLNITGTVAAGTYYYRVNVGSACGGTVTSATRTLTVTSPASIGGHPSDATQCQGTFSQTFTVTASNATGYQWQYSPDNTNWSNVANGTPTNAQYSGANAATLTVQSIGSGIPNGTYYYRAVVSGCSGPVNSNSASLTINTCSTPTKLAFIGTIGTQVTGTAFSITVQSQDASNNPAAVSSNTPITITVNTGSGSVTGSGTITAGNHTATFNVTYTLSGTDGETGVSLQASATGLSSANSNTFTVLPTEPTTQTSNIVLATRTQTSITVAMTAGNGAGRLVAATKTTNTYYGYTPTDGTSYSIGDAFGTNTTIINKGNITSAIVTGLSPNQWATFRAFEYNGNTVPNYNTSTASYNPRALKTLAKEIGEDGVVGTTLAIASLTPNPVTDDGFAVQLLTDEAGEVRLEIVNELGEAIFSNAAKLDAGNHIMNLTMPADKGGLAAGTYFLRITLNGETIVKKFVYMP